MDGGLAGTVEEVVGLGRVGWVGWVDVGGPDAGVLTGGPVDTGGRPSVVRGAVVVDVVPGPKHRPPLATTHTVRPVESRQSPSLATVHTSVPWASRQAPTAPTPQVVVVEVVPASTVEGLDENAPSALRRWVSPVEALGTVTPT